jgi:hypothetical protein
VAVAMSAMIVVVIAVVMGVIDGLGEPKAG